jgi:hypothetical protein
MWDLVVAQMKIAKKALAIRDLAWWIAWMA